MKRQVTVLLLLLLILSSSATEMKAHEQTFQDVNASQAVIGTNIAYQGRLNDNGQPANGAYDLQFQLYDAVSSGTQVGNTVTQEDVFITDGMFSVQLDFGGNAFDGNRRYLAVAVRPGNSNDTYTALNPRQELTPVPYALGLPNVSVRDGNVGIGSTDPSAKLDIKDSSPTNSGIKIETTNIGDVNTALRIQGPVGTERAIGFYTNNTLEWWFGRDNRESAATAGIGFWRNGIGFPFVIGDNGNIGINASPPDKDSNKEQSIKLDIGGRVRVRQGDTLGPGIWFYGENTNSDQAFVGMANEHQVGFWGNNGAQWGVVMDTASGDVDIKGKTSTKILQINGGADLAEFFSIKNEMSIIPGLVVSIDPKYPGQLRIADSAYDHTVAGIISGAGGVNPGLVMQQQNTIAAGNYPVSVIGRVYAWADASYGSIQPGDLLTTSDTPGHVMKAADNGKAHGALIGKAMTGLEEEKGLVLILISLH